MNKTNLREQLEEVINLINIKNKEVWDELDILQYNKAVLIYSIIKEERLLEGKWHYEDGICIFRITNDIVRPILNNLLNIEDNHGYYRILEYLELSYDDNIYTLFIHNCDIQAIKNIFNDLSITLNLDSMIDEKQRLQQRILEIDKKYNELLEINNGKI